MNFENAAGAPGTEGVSSSPPPGSSPVPGCSPPGCCSGVQETVIKPTPPEKGNQEDAGKQYAKNAFHYLTDI